MQCKIQIPVDKFVVKSS